MTLVKNLLPVRTSTGGLTASSYMNTGAERNRINALILNSPFLDFYQSGFESSSAIGVRNYFHNSSVCKKLKVLPVYAQSLYKDYSGEWDYNDWKPIKDSLPF
jgi:alpha-beta hydrolase superfamily lysophospholipase